MARQGIASSLAFRFVQRCKAPSLAGLPTLHIGLSPARFPVLLRYVSLSLPVRPKDTGGVTDKGLIGCALADGFGATGTIQALCANSPKRCCWCLSHHAHPVMEQRAGRDRARPGVAAVAPVAILANRLSRSMALARNRSGVIGITHVLPLIEHRES